MAKLWLIPIILFLLLWFAYARTDDGPRADFVFVNTSDLHTLDPARMSWTPDFRVALNLWEGLTSWDPRDNCVIGAAAEYPPEQSDDGLTYRFTIRSDARWSNGDPVTSDDFVRGWRRAIEPGSAADYSFLLTEHLVGAREYVDWRREGVAVLTALERLCDGKPLTPRQEEALHSSPELSSILEPAIERVPPEKDRTNEPRTMAAEGGGRHDWCAIRDEYFEAHVVGMEARFRGVGVETPDPQTLVVHLTSPAPYFLDITGLPVFLPCHVSLEHLRHREGAAPITQRGLVIHDPQWTKPDYHAFGYPGLVTNGAYRLVEWTFKRRARLEVNPYHRESRRVGCRTVEMRVYDNINAALLAFEAGDVDFLPSLAVSYDHEIARLSRTGARPDLHLCDVLATYFLLFNCADATVHGALNPFTDPVVRQAFALAIDRSLLVERVLARGDRAARSFVPPRMIPGYDPPAAPDFDVDRARGLLAQQGYADGGGLEPIELLCTQRDQRVVQAIARQWEHALNVRVYVRLLETRVFAEEKASRRFMVSTGNWYGDYFDPSTFLDCLSTGSGNNDAGYSSTDYDSLLSTAQAASDSADRLRLLAEAEAILLRKDVPLVPLLHYAEPVAIQSHVSGLYPNARLWFPFHRVSVRR